MDPTVLQGTRKPLTSLDWAVFEDIGWDLSGMNLDRTHGLPGTLVVRVEDAAGRGKPGVFFRTVSPETCEDLGGLQICGTEILVSRTNSRGYFSDFLPGGTWRVEVDGQSFPVNVDGGLHPVVVSEGGGLSLTRNLIISDADERVLYVTGTNGNDSIELRRSGASIVVNVNQEQQSHSLEDFDRIELQSLDGVDTITIHFGAGNPIPDGGIEIDGGSGGASTGTENRLILNGTQVGPVPVRFESVSMDAYAEGAGILDLDDTRIRFTGLGQGDVEARRIDANDFQIGVDNDGATTFRNTLHISPAREFVLGANDGSSGRYVLGGDSLLNVDVARIGSQGTGELTVDTPTAWFFANRMTVGEFSTGVVRQTDGYVLARESLVLGASPGAEGTYFLDGGLIDVAALQSGEGQGTLHIRGGALVADSIDVPVIQTAGICSPDGQNGPVAFSDYTMRGGTLAPPNPRPGRRPKARPNTTQRPLRGRRGPDGGCGRRLCTATGRHVRLLRGQDDRRDV